MDECGLTDITQDSLDFVTSPPQNSPGFRGIIIGESTGDFISVGIKAAYDLPPPEITADICYTYRQETFAAGRERFHRAFIQCDISANLQMIGKPLFARSKCHGFRQQLGADGFSLSKANQDVGFMPRRDHGVRAATRSPFCSD